MLCTWSIFPFFPLSFQLVMVKTKESGPSGDFDEFCPKLSSESVHSYRAPTLMLPPHFLNRLGLSELLSRCGQRPDLSGSHLRGGVQGSISICLVHPTINTMLTSTPLHQGHSSRVTVCMTSLSCRPCFWFFFFNLCGLCNCSLLYTLVLNGYIGRLSRSLTLSLSFQKFPWSHLPSQFAFVGLQLPGFYYRLFLWKCFFSLECLSAAVIKYFKYLKCFCFASLCLDLQLNMGRT